VLALESTGGNNLIEAGVGLLGFAFALGSNKRSDVITMRTGDWTSRNRSLGKRSDLIDIGVTVLLAIVEPVGRAEGGQLMTTAGKIPRVTAPEVVAYCD
jgi:hypothetical protein